MLRQQHIYYIYVAADDIKLSYCCCLLSIIPHKLNCETKSGDQRSSKFQIPQQVKEGTFFFAFYNLVFILTSYILLIWDLLVIILDAGSSINR